MFGVVHEVPDSTLTALLDAIGLPANTAEERAAAFESMRQTLARPLPPVKVLPEHRLRRIPLPGVVEWSLTDEAGTLQTHSATRDEITLPALPMGYYELRATLRSGESIHTHLIVSPEQCWMPEEMQGGKRVWGLAAQLYGVRSARNFGMGDFSDLATLGETAAKAGADLIGINPIHAMYPCNEYHFSPYSPSSRLYLNALYIDPRAVDGFAQCEAAQALWNGPEFQAKLEATRSAELVDYPHIAQLKYPLLEALYEHFQARGDKTDFERFVQEQGELLTDQALFDALNEYFVRQRGHFVCWWEWPEDYRSARGEAAQKFARQNEARLQYFRWLQWVADTQLKCAQRRARDSGMLLGLYRDLAVGSDQAGAEVWLEPDRFIRGVAVGAPPDRRNPRGQNWGLPPLNPINLREQGYTPFIQLVRANTRHARALRIDHAFGLARLFLIPNGESPRNGAYLTFNFEEMLAVLRLESHRNKCVIIGEDLGTFPPNYAEGAAASGLLSYRLLYFQRDTERFLPPGRYPSQALATLSTHDLPTLDGWLAMADIAEREALDLYPTPDMPDKDRAERTTIIPWLSTALAREGLADAAALPTLEAVQRYLARSPAAIIMMQLEDLLGVVRQANIPATTTQRPNWRMRLPVGLEEIVQPQGALTRIAPALNEERASSLVRPPRATYRLQFHKDFTFADAAVIVPYLAKLGISHVYASPYMASRPSSTHGYDITDHNRLNPELGGEEGYRLLTTTLKTHGIGQLLDFVPNHMGVGQDNAWWMSVLEWGRHSPHAHFFDIDWKPRYPGGPSKLILPALGSHYGEALQQGELKLVFDAENGAFQIDYSGNHFPICPRNYHDIFPPAAEAPTVAEGEALKQRLAEATADHAAMHEAAATLSADQEALHALLEKQHYRLAFWRVAASEVNYRRFFDINELAGLRAEDPKVFAAMHPLVLSLIAEGSVQGLRIDHIDGLADPERYVRQLKAAAGAGLYLTVEKILGPTETLREDWAVDGTSGYDGLNLINGLFVARESEKYFDRIYRRYAGNSDSFGETVLEAKYLILDTGMASEVNVLALGLKRLADRSPFTRDYTFDGLKATLKDIIAYFPVYRAYSTERFCAEEDRRIIDFALRRARQHSQQADRSMVDFIGTLLKMEQDRPDEETLDFVRRFQQLTGPVMAKGLEDTSFYRYVRLLSLNEVGGDAGRFGIGLEAFHRQQQARAARWPHSQIATATHDTKRGEDARARLNALSELPREWLRHLARWQKLVAAWRTETEEGLPIPSPNEEYFLYQTLLASWPVEMLEKADASGLEAFGARIKEYLTKALREGKRTSSWMNPDEAYEVAVHAFVDCLLDPAGSNAFLADFLPFAWEIAERGVIHSLSQTLLKLTLPGVPDIYQGTEYWDLSLVDPDNRRPVDYAARAARLDHDPALPALLEHWQDGRVKQELIARLLAHRAEHSGLYTDGDYQPLSLEGPAAERFLAFSRTSSAGTLTVIVPIRTLEGNEQATLTLSAPAHHLLTHTPIPAGKIALNTLLTPFPLAVLVST